MSTDGKERILALVAESSLPRRQVLAQLGLAKSTYYRWRRRQAEGRLEDERAGPRLPWNKLRPEERALILAHARASPELSPRQLALRITDREGVYVSESTVYRVLKQEGLFKPAETGFKPAREYPRKTKMPNELWATDCVRLEVTGWGSCYLVIVMDDFSRFILAWKLLLQVTVDSLIDVVQEALRRAGITDAPVEERIILLSDISPGYLSRKFGEYLRLAGIEHIAASPYHPQAEEKMERRHRVVKKQIDLLPCDAPADLEEVVRSFVQYSNYQRYHESLGDVAPFDVYTGQRRKTLQRRKKAKQRTLSARKHYNNSVRQQSSGL